LAVVPGGRARSERQAGRLACASALVLIVAVLAVLIVGKLQRRSHPTP
jgi:hypothetical protein